MSFDYIIDPNNAKLVSTIMVVMSSVLIAAYKKYGIGAAELHASRLTSVTTLASLRSQIKEIVCDAKLDAEKKNVAIREIRHLQQETYAILCDYRLKPETIISIQRLENPSHAIELYRKYNLCISEKENGDFEVKGSFGAGCGFIIVSILFFGFGYVGLYGIYPTEATETDLLSKAFSFLLTLFTWIAGFFSMIKGFDYLTTTKKYLNKTFGVKNNIEIPDKENEFHSILNIEGHNIKKSN